MEKNAHAHGLPSLPCPKCGTTMEWRLYKNVEWAKYPKRYQLFCPTCGKMRRGRLPVRV